MKSALFAALAAAFVVVAAPSAQRELRERHVFISVTDKADIPLSSLAPADVVVREDGVAREVLKVGPAAPPSHIALLVDDSAVAESLVPDLRIGLTAFVRAAAALSPAPAIGVTTFGERPTRLVEYTPSGPVVERAVGKIFARANAGAHLLDAIFETCQDLRKRKAERPVIVVFVAEDGPEFSNITHDRVADALKEARASLFTIALQGRGSALTSTEARERAQVVSDVTRDSGGITRPILSKQALENTYKSVAAMLGSRFDVTYGRPDAMIPPTKLEVEVRRPDARVAAPRWAWR